MADPEKSQKDVLRQLNHDLRSPLSTIAIGIEALRAVKHDAAQVDALLDMMAEQGVEAIKKILADLP